MPAIKKFFLYLALPTAILFIPAVSSAHVPNILSGGYWGGVDSETGMSGIVSCTPPITVQPANGPPDANGNYPPPVTAPSQHACMSLCDLIHTLLHVIAFGESLALYAGAPILFAWGGILIIISSGNPGKISEGKKILTGTIIGVLIMLSAYLIVSTFINVLGLANFIPLTLQCMVR